MRERVRKPLEEQAAALVSAADLRAERARQRLPIYILGAMCNLHPGRLARMLNEQILLPEHIAKRVAEVLLNNRDATPKKMPAR
jgi:hypothetical protein